MSHQIDTLEDAVLVDEESAPFLKHIHRKRVGEDKRRYCEQTNKFLFPMSVE